LLNNEPGPRDWTQPAGVSRSLASPAPRVRNAVISMVAGSIALALGLLPLVGGHPTLILSTVGITAIVAGLTGFTRWSWAGFGTRLMSSIGAAFGAIGIVLTVAAVLHFSVAGGAAPQAAPVDPFGAPTVAPTAPGAAPTPAPTLPSVGLSATDARVAQYAGSAVFLLRHSHDMTGAYPDTLPSDPGSLIVTAAGSLRLPPDVRLSYTVRDDGSGFEMLALSDDDSVVIEFDTASGVLQWVHR